MIIDIHGHYTTAPKALEAWRNRQIAGIQDAALKPRVADLAISDDELLEFLTEPMGDEWPDVRDVVCSACASGYNVGACCHLPVLTGICW